MSPVIQQWACCGLVAGSRGWESHSRLQLSLAGRKARMPSLPCLHTSWSLKVCMFVCVCLSFFVSLCVKWMLVDVCDVCMLFKINWSFLPVLLDYITSILHKHRFSWQQGYTWRIFWKVFNLASLICVFIQHKILVTIKKMHAILYKSHFLVLLPPKQSYTSSFSLLLIQNVASFSCSFCGQKMLYLSGDVSEILLQKRHRWVAMFS